MNRSLDNISRFADTPMRKVAAAKLSLQGNDYKSAEAALRSVTIELPNLSNAWVMLGSINEHEGDMLSAAMNYRRALFTDPINLVALASLANADQIIGEDQEGLQAAQSALMANEPSEHVMRSSRMYHMNPLSFDDLVPSGILSYTEPKIDIDLLCRITYDISVRQAVEVPEEVAEKIKSLGGKC